MRRQAPTIRRRQSRHVSLFDGGARLSPRVEKADHALVDQRRRESIRPSQTTARAIREDFDFRVFDAPNDRSSDLFCRLNMPCRLKFGFHVTLPDMFAEFRFG